MQEEWISTSTMILVRGKGLEVLCHESQPGGRWVWLLSVTFYIRFTSVNGVVGFYQLSCLTWATHVSFSSGSTKEETLFSRLSKGFVNEIPQVVTYGSNCAQRACWSRDTWFTLENVDVNLPVTKVAVLLLTRFLFLPCTQRDKH